VEIREVENEPIFHKMTAKTLAVPIVRSSAPRQPLRPLTAAINVTLDKPAAGKDKPIKSFTVYAEKLSRHSVDIGRTTTLKRTSNCISAEGRPAKHIRRQEPEVSRADLENMVDRMVEEKLASRALIETSKTSEPALSAEVQRRLESLEQRVEKKEDSRAEGLQFLLMAKQHQVRGEDASALRMYQLALPYFPNNEKLAQKMLSLQDKIHRKREDRMQVGDGHDIHVPRAPVVAHEANNENHDADEDDEYRPMADNEDETHEEDDFPKTVNHTKPRPKSKPLKMPICRDDFQDITYETPSETSPRTRNLLRIINSRDIAAIKSLRGVGAKKAEAIVSCLCSLGDDDMDGGGGQIMAVKSLEQLGGIKGVGAKTVETMRLALAV